MALVPDAAAETVPGYVTDGAGNWFQIGVGEHTHADYLPLTGGTIAPGPLNVPAPASGTSAARWADAVPRFTNAATRDAAYTSVGGPAEGMVCYMIDDKTYRQYVNATDGWVYAYQGGRNSTVSTPLTAGQHNLITWPTLKVPNVKFTDMGNTGARQSIQVTHAGMYTVNAYVVIAGGPGAVHVDLRRNEVTTDWRGGGYMGNAAQILAMNFTGLWNVGDYFDLGVYPATGVAATVSEANMFLTSAPLV